ncbi:MAG: M1 family metallopeptidase [Saprospiraceae bacterium]|nr:MAG: aminopeptidase N [Candidatus Parvibacillus calidus]MCC7148375.1 M1 family metallopeptidase [Saprospiraceae bacterium]
MQLGKFALLFVFILLFVSCRPQLENIVVGNASEGHVDDPHSFGDNSAARVRHLKLDLSVDFSQRLVSGFALLTIAKNGADTLFLDSNELKIDSMKSKGQHVVFTISTPEKYLGSKIIIPLASVGDTVAIYYSASKDAVALQWLSPEQTYDKKYPFLYTQGQPNLTRSWIPVQDSPGIRFTYDATLRVPAGLMALMSAVNPQTPVKDGVYYFHMDEPIPAYLLVMAVGNLAFHAFDNRSGVYAEPGQLKAAVFEFSETPEMIRTAESLYGPYAWGRYDILVLPPAFPFGGMENPRLTFATPTVIAGDRSLANLIAHELAHSWSGNLVTNATWNDFWLNEGFTTYFERRIVEKVKNKDYADMNSIIGRNDLDIELADFGLDSQQSRLKQNLNGENPDDAMTDIPYEKGYLFLVLLERTFGREKMDDFLNGYFAHFKFNTITTEEFVKYLYSKFDAVQLDKIHTNDWIYKPGIPDNAPVFESKMFEAVEKEEPALIGGTSRLAYKDWDFNQWLYFLRRIKGKTGLNELNRLNESYHFLESQNTEILAIWLENNIVLKNTAINGKVNEFLGRVGRRKFLEPLYKALLQSGQKDVALEIYRQHRSGYHSVSQHSLDKMLDYKPTK